MERRRPFFESIQAIVIPLTRIYWRVTLIPSCINERISYVIHSPWVLLTLGMGKCSACEFGTFGSVATS